MKIDCYPHILAAPVRDRLDDLPLPTLRNPVLLDVDERFRVMDRFEDYTQILVPFPMQPIVPFFASPSVAVDAVRAGNDELAILVDKHPDRFAGWACAVPLFDVDEAERELARCLDELGALGVQLETNVGGVPIDAPAFEALFAEVAARGKAVWLHPVRGKAIPDFASEATGRFGLWQALGWPYETSLVMARLVLGGLFTRHPDLRVIIHHGGAMVPHFCNRLGEVLEHMGQIGFDAELSEAVAGLDRPVDELLRSFYADTVLFGAEHAVQCVIDYFGVDHVLFGTDMPFDPEQGPGFVRDTIANVDALPLDDAQRAAVYEHNARRLFHL